MTKIPFDLVGFDLDGTLLDTSGDLTAAVNHTLAIAGRPLLTPDQVKPMIGGGAKMMLEHGLAVSGGVADGEFKPLYRIMLTYYEANVSVETRLFPGAAGVLDALDAIGVPYGVVTNKFESLAVKALTELGLIDRFVTVIGGDTLGPGNAKPSAAPILELIRRAGLVPGEARAVFIGDSIYDTMAARAAGIPSIACRFGFLMHPIEQLEADAVIDHFDDLIGTLAGM